MSTRPKSAGPLSSLGDNAKTGSKSFREHRAQLTKATAQTSKTVGVQVLVPQPSRARPASVVAEYNSTLPLSGMFSPPPPRQRTGDGVSNDQRRAKTFGGPPPAFLARMAVYEQVCQQKAKKRAEETAAAAAARSRSARGVRRRVVSTAPAPRSSSAGVGPQRSVSASAAGLSFHSPRGVAVRPATSKPDVARPELLEARRKAVARAACLSPPISIFVKEPPPQRVQPRAAEASARDPATASPSSGPSRLSLLLRRPSLAPAARRRADAASSRVGAGEATGRPSLFRANGSIQLPPSPASGTGHSSVLSSSSSSPRLGMGWRASLQPHTASNVPSRPAAVSLMFSPPHQPAVPRTGGMRGSAVTGQASAADRRKRLAAHFDAAQTRPAQPRSASALSAPNGAVAAARRQLLLRVDSSAAVLAGAGRSSRAQGSAGVGPAQSASRGRRGASASSSSTSAHRAATGPGIVREIAVDAAAQRAAEAEALTAWLNGLLCPPAPVLELELLHAGGAQGGVRDARALIEAARRDARIQRAAFKLYHGPGVQGTLGAVNREIAAGRLGMHPDSQPHVDMGLRARLSGLLLGTYHPLWLKLGLELVMGEPVPLPKQQRGQAAASAANETAASLGSSGSTPSSQHQPVRTSTAASSASSKRPASAPAYARHTESSAAAAAPSRRPFLRRLQTGPLPLERYRQLAVTREHELKAARKAKAAPAQQSASAARAPSLARPAHTAAASLLQRSRSSPAVSARSAPAKASTASAPPAPLDSARAKAAAVSALTSAVKRFMSSRLWSDPDIAAAHAAVSISKNRLFGKGEHDLAVQQQRRSLSRVLSLILFLDRARSADLLEGSSACLFRSDSPIKSSAGLLQAFSREALRGHGDVLRQLAPLGYTLQHSQSRLEEATWEVSQLSSDLRDGTILVRLAEVLSRVPALSLCRVAHLRLPAPTRTNKLHNASAALSALAKGLGIDVSGPAPVASGGPSGRPGALRLGRWRIGGGLVRAVSAAPAASKPRLSGGFMARRSVFSKRTAASAAPAPRSASTSAFEPPLTVLRTPVPVTARDIVDGHQDRTCALLWTLFAATSGAMSSASAAPSAAPHACLVDGSKLEAETAKLASAHPSSAAALAVLPAPSSEGAAATRTLLRWAQAVTTPRGVRVTDLSRSFADGRAWCALISHYHPELLSKSSVGARTATTLLLAKQPQPASGLTDSEPTKATFRSGVSEATLTHALSLERVNHALAARACASLGVPHALAAFLAAADTLHPPSDKCVALLLAHLTSRLMDVSAHSAAAQRIQAAWRLRLWRKDRAARKRLALIARSVAATKLACWYRALLPALPQRDAGRAACTIQRAFRCAAARRALTALHSADAERRLSLRARHAAAFRADRSRRRAVVAIQRTVRGFLVRRHLAVQHAAAMRIQAAWRGFHVRTPLLIQAAAAYSLQAWWRGAIGRRRFLILRSAVVTLQRAYRSMWWVDPSDHNARRVSIGSPQPFVAERVRARLEREWLRGAAATMVQSVWRGFAQRARFRALRFAAVSLQGAYRRRRDDAIIAAITDLDLTAISKIGTESSPSNSAAAAAHLLLPRSPQRPADVLLTAATVVTSFMRMTHVRLRFLVMRAAAVRLQSIARMAPHRVRFLYSRAVASWLAAVWHGYRARKQLKTARTAATAVQSWWRGQVAQCRYLYARSRVPTLQRFARAALWRLRDARHRQEGRELTASAEGAVRAVLSSAHAHVPERLVRLSVDRAVRAAHARMSTRIAAIHEQETAAAIAAAEAPTLPAVEPKTPSRRGRTPSKRRTPGPKTAAKSEARRRKAASTARADADAKRRAVLEEGTAVARQAAAGSAAVAVVASKQAASAASARKAPRPRTPSATGSRTPGRRASQAASDDENAELLAEMQESAVSLYERILSLMSGAGVPQLMRHASASLLDAAVEEVPRVLHAAGLLPEPTVDGAMRSILSIASPGEASLLVPLAAAAAGSESAAGSRFLDALSLSRSAAGMGPASPPSAGGAARLDFASPPSRISAGGALSVLAARRKSSGSKSRARPAHVYAPLDPQDAERMRARSGSKGRGAGGSGAMDAALPPAPRTPGRTPQRASPAPTPKSGGRGRGRTPRRDAQLLPGQEPWEKVGAQAAHRGAGTPGRVKIYHVNAGDEAPLLLTAAEPVKDAATVGAKKSSSLPPLAHPPRHPAGQSSLGLLRHVAPLPWVSSGASVAGSVESARDRAHRRSVSSTRSRSHSASARRSVATADQQAALQGVLARALQEVGSAASPATSVLSATDSVLPVESAAQREARRRKRAEIRALRVHGDACSVRSGPEADQLSSPGAAAVQHEAEASAIALALAQAEAEVGQHAEAMAQVEAEMHDCAATMLQAWWRTLCASSRYIVLRHLAIRVQRMWRAHALRKTSAAARATVAEYVQQELRECAATTLQSFARMAIIRSHYVAYRKQAWYDIHTSAAVTIQAFARMALCRARYLTFLVTSAEETQVRAHFRYLHAVTALQARWRGHAARAQYTILRARALVARATVQLKPQATMPKRSDASSHCIQPAPAAVFHSRLPVRKASSPALAGSTRLALQPAAAGTYSTVTASSAQVAAPDMPAPVAVPAPVVQQHLTSVPARTVAPAAAPRVRRTVKFAEHLSTASPPSVTEVHPALLASAPASAPVRSWTIRQLGTAAPALVAPAAASVPLAQVSVMMPITPAPPAREHDLTLGSLGFDWDLENAMPVSTPPVVQHRLATQAAHAADPAALLNATATFDAAVQRARAALVVIATSHRRAKYVTAMGELRDAVASSPDALRFVAQDAFVHALFRVLELCTKATASHVTLAEECLAVLMRLASAGAEQCLCVVGATNAVGSLCATLTTYERVGSIAGPTAQLLHVLVNTSAAVRAQVASAATPAVKRALDGVAPSRAGSGGNAIGRRVYF